MKKLIILAASSALLASCGQQATDAAATDASPVAEASATAFGFDASGLPVLRPGLWEFTQSDDGEAPDVHQECLVHGVNEETRAALTAPAGPNCTKTVNRTNGVTVSGTCIQPGGVQTTTSLSISGSDSAITARLTLSAAAPGQPAEASESVVRGRWLSPCDQTTAP